MRDIKPIETYYNGYRFRSRLEARWAVFFDKAGITYQYEPEGYSLANGNYYLPDFYLPRFDLHVEVKRNTAEGVEEIKNKCMKAISWGGPIKQILILSDVPEGRSVDGGIWHYPIIFFSGTRAIWGWWFFYDDHEGSVDGNISAADYPNPGWYLLEKKKSIEAITDYELRKCRDLHWRRFSDFSIEDEIEMQEDFNRQVFASLKAARQARFEHGETPDINKHYLNEECRLYDIPF